MMKETGVAAVKFEGGKRVVPQIRALTDAGIPVVAHLGYTPQSENLLGGPRVQGRGDLAAELLCEDAVAIAEAGAVAVVLEMVPAPVAARVTEILQIPTIGIGAGADCDGQVLVWVDMAGMTDWSPRFAKRFGEVGAALRAAARAYADEVRGGTFPDRGAPVRRVSATALHQSGSPHRATLARRRPVRTASPRPPRPRPRCGARALLQRVRRLLAGGVRAHELASSRSAGPPRPRGSRC